MYADLKIALDKRVEAYNQDPSTAVSGEESKRRIEEILKTSKKQKKNELMLIGKT